ncbi:hypothetical protein EV384_4530 [Micromonospora kangleipakensis]|uniref:SUKH superfamily protein n=1 Tax=Micromonospora kangleipakensis TaxID=1077942 RepID=A0A4Q8BDI7_9ACTN|nr:hypothetical protein [Micromonospora kangleipakensis]RZU75950.1 hypothetical protein EV384_4530 [Micromonospora kangleipakensis]
MTSAFDKLVELVRPPAEPAGDVDWTGVETSIGVRLPTDYKLLVETYGHGQFDRFLTVYQPVTPFLTIELSFQARRKAEILAQLRAGGREHIPFGEGTLLPVAGTDNGDTVYWVLHSPDDPASWTITANEARDTRWPEFTGGITDFLYAVLSRQVRFPIFPKDFPSSRTPRFRPMGAPDPRRVAIPRAQGLYRDL